MKAKALGGIISGVVLLEAGLLLMNYSFGLKDSSYSFVYCINGAWCASLGTVLLCINVARAVTHES